MALQFCPMQTTSPLKVTTVYTPAFFLPSPQLYLSTCPNKGMHLADQLHTPLKVSCLWLSSEVSNDRQLLTLEAWVAAEG